MRELFIVACIFILVGLVSYISLLPSYYNVKLARDLLIIGIIVLAIMGLVYER